MKQRQNKIFSFFMAIIFTGVTVFQAIEGNYLAIFPFACALIFFIKGLRMKG